MVETSLEVEFRIIVKFSGHLVNEGELIFIIHNYTKEKSKSVTVLVKYFTRINIFRYCCILGEWLR